MKRSMATGGAREKEEDLTKETEKEQPLVPEDNEENKEEGMSEKWGLCKRRLYVLEMYADKVTIFSTFKCFCKN